MLALRAADRPQVASTERLRVVLAAEASGGGVGKHVVDLAERLPAHGFDVLLLYGRRRIGEGFGERVAAHGDFGYATATFDADRAPGVGDFRAGAELRRVIRAFGPADVLHAHSSKAGALARLARWGVARRVVYTPHAWYTQNPNLGRRARDAYRLIELGLSTLTDRIISVSRDEVEHGVSMGIPERKVVLIENGVEPWSPAHLARVRQTTRAQLRIAASDVVVGFLGRLVDQKAPEVALRVFRDLIDTRPELRPVLVGDGPEAGMVRQAIDEMGLAGAVRWVPTALASEMMPAFDVFLLTSRYEGFPYVLLEALSAGCAIVTTRVGGATDCVEEGRNGFIVRPGDQAGLTSSVLALTARADQLRTAQARSRERAGLFSLERMVARTADLYRSLHEDN
jgi:glycosyltransferase involved in cell wall biosynthesis